MSYNNQNGNYRQSRGNYSQPRGNYQNSYSGYKRNAPAQSNPSDNKLGSRFRIKGIVCTSKNGMGFTEYKTKSGKSICRLNVMVGRNVNSGQRDEQGNIIWDRNVEYFNLVAFGENAEIVKAQITPKSTVDFSGDIRIEGRDGQTSFSFIVDKITVVKKYEGSTSGYVNTTRSASPDGKTPYRREEQRNSSVSYEDRPNNGYSRPPARTEASNRREPSYENGYDAVPPAGTTDTDIPF